MKKIHYIILFIFLINVPTIYAQQELGLNLNKNVWQSNHTNPAFMSKLNVVIALPNFYTETAAKGLKYGDLITRNEKGSTINVNDLLTKLPAQNAIINQQQIDILNVGFRVKKAFISLGMSSKSNFYLGYPTSLLDLAWNGNSKFIGKTVDLSLDIESYLLSEKYLGVAYQLNDKLAIGFRAKALSSRFGISTERHVLSLYTDPDVYQLTLKSDYRISASNLGEYAGKGSFSTTDILNGNFATKDAISGGANKGFSLDLGATYKVSEKLELAASVVDLVGKINWKNNVINLSNKGESTFKGLDFGVILRGDTTTYKKVMDSLAQKFDFATTNENFVSKLPLKTYLSATYKVSKKLQLGALFFTENYKQKTQAAFALNATTYISGWLNIGASWAYRQGSAANIGINAVGKLGPIQVFAIADNILPIVRLDKSALNVNGRIGMNIIFGKQKAIASPDVSIPIK